MRNDQKSALKQTSSQVNILIKAHKNVAKAISHAMRLKHGFRGLLKKTFKTLSKVNLRI